MARYRCFGCDIDALPIVEQTVLSYRSKQKGKCMFAGHDMHIVAGLAVRFFYRKIEISYMVS